MASAAADPPTAATDPATDPGVPSHRRTISVEVFEEGGDFRVVGRLHDERPWAETDRVRDVHRMELEMTVRRTDLTITGARAAMERFPHAECPAIEPAFQGLVGLSVARGYTRAVQERFGRQKGCSHLEVLARTMGPAVIQALPSSAARVPDAEEGQRVMSESPLGWLANTCHVWADDGPGPKKVAAGWRPTGERYPAPAVAEIQAEARRAGAEQESEQESE